MKLLGLVVILAAMAGCTKQNPNLCCTDAADCAAQGLSSDSQCADGLLCRGNQCIAVTCSASVDCDASAPYCVDSSCSEACTSDAQCPGFGQSLAPYCVDGACVHCRADVPSDCPMETPVCDAGACRACVSHSECASGVCKRDGACASEADIAYAEPGGPDSGLCTRTQKCSLEHAGAQVKPYVLLAAGTYTSSSTVTFGGTTSVIGSSPLKPTITRSTQGPVITIGQGDVSMEFVQVSGAKGTTMPYGYGIDCPASPSGARHLRLVDVDVIQNASVGVNANKCTIDVIRSSFVSNGDDGLSVVDGGGTIERSTAASNAGDGFSADAGVYVIRNVFAYRNGRAGIDLFGNPGSAIEFCTAADNTEVGITCGNAAGGFAFPNNIAARNGQDTQTGCTYPGSIVSTSVNGLNFKSSETAPYDYHITAGSIAIDAATQSTVATDFDGDMRPQGAQRDVGADEFVP